jgi:hypothetical protein
MHFCFKRLKQISSTRSFMMAPTFLAGSDQESFPAMRKQPSPSSLINF